MLEASRARGERRTLVTTRHAARADELRRSLDVGAVLLGDDDATRSATAAALSAAVDSRTDVLVSFPPDAVSDAAYAHALRAVRRVVYISSTGVFGALSGAVDDTTDVDRNDARAVRRLEAEARWRSVGATVLRAPAIYSVGSGLHQRLLAGTYRLPDDGARRVSRVHVDDLAALALAALERAAPGSTYVVGDQAPAPQREVVEWLCARLALPLPPAARSDERAAPLISDRSIDGRRALHDLGVTLRYPSYREGYEAVLRARQRV